MCFIFKKKYNARYYVEKKGKTVCKQLFSTIIILHKISKQKTLKQKRIYLFFFKNFILLTITSCKCYTAKGAISTRWYSGVLFFN